MCWDQWYPEGARLTAAQGANVLFYPTAIGWHPDEKAQYGEAQYDAWRTIQRSHAIANGVYVAAVNRVGFETGNIRGNEAPGKGLEFWGGSFIADPFGQVVAEASHDQGGQSCSPKSICIGSRMSAATGHSGATAVSTPTLPSRNGFWCKPWQRTPMHLQDTPAALGYRMPGEWEPHEATWIAWPHNRTDWPGKFASIPWVYAEIVRHLARVERVNILVNNEAAETAARNVLVTAEVLPKSSAEPGTRSGNMKFWHIPTNRGWTARYRTDVLCAARLAEKHVCLVGRHRMAL